MYTAEATVRVDADQRRAWDFVSNYQNFDRIMSNIQEITLESGKHGAGETSHWTMRGPLGIPVSWRAVTTSMEAPSYLAWKSTEGSLETSGYIRVLPETSGSSVTVHVEYIPPLGGLGEAVAKLFNDPQRQLEDDLSKLGSLIADAPVRAQETASGAGMATQLGATQTESTGISLNNASSARTASGDGYTPGSVGGGSDYGMTGNLDDPNQRTENMGGMAGDTGEMLTDPSGKTIDEQVNNPYSTDGDRSNSNYVAPASKRSGS